MEQPGLELVPILDAGTISRGLFAVPLDWPDTLHYVEVIFL